MFPMTGSIAELPLLRALHLSTVHCGVLETPAAQVRFLAAKEQDRLGFVLMDQVEDELLSLNEAKRLGINRLEFNRRRTLVEKVCPHHGLLRHSGESFVRGYKAGSEEHGSDGTSALMASPV